MNSNNASRIFLCAFLASQALIAQVRRDVAPLKYWPAPLYWQPTQAENLMARKSEASGNVAPAEALPLAQTPADSLVFVAMTPCRLVDTRPGSTFTGDFGPPSLVAGVPRSFPIQASSTCPIPSIALAYSLNITVIPPGPLGYLTIWPYGSAQPIASTLNDSLGTVVANAAIVPAGNDVSGSVDVYVDDATNLVIDINGYYAAQSGITLAQGTAAAPSLSFAGDSGTGVYSSGMGTVNISTGGTSRLMVDANGDVDIPGSIRKNGTLFLQNLGDQNTAVGLSALNVNTGSLNTAIGFDALSSNTTGALNTAGGSNALLNNTTGTNDTAIGTFSLFLNTNGSQNTASGSNSLNNNSSGSFNTATGYNALFANTTGNNNTALGANALGSNNTGFNNTASGSQALQYNSTGFGNTATGDQALNYNTIGIDNTASGMGALQNNTTGLSNTATGNLALLNNTTGSNNTALGYQAGQNVTVTGNNIEIGNQGTVADAGVIRIGTSGTQTTAFFAGIQGVTTGTNDAVPVVIDSTGQLGTVSSSRRYKEDIQDMGEASDGLLRLRPVTFHYKRPFSDGSKPIQYGLVAEEVAAVYPDLVARSADGQIETVKYQVLDSMLLNELQKQSGTIAAQKEQIRQQDQQINSLEQRLTKLEAALEGSASVAASH